MKKEKIQQLKNQKYFKKADVFVYICLAVLIVLLFWVFVFAQPKTSLDELKIIRQSRTGESVVFNYNFEKNTYFIPNEFEKLVEVTQNSEGHLVKIATENGNGFNEIQIGNRVAYVKDANCSFHQDCMKFPNIIANDNIIICVPHHLTIIGIGNIMISDDDDPIIG